MIRTYDDFVKVHGILLAASGVPPSLHRQLFEKLSTDTFDGGEFFEVEAVEDGRQRRLVLTSDSMEKESRVFLVDHAWTFRLDDARKQVCISYNYQCVSTSVILIRWCTVSVWFS